MKMANEYTEKSCEGPGCDNIYSTWYPESKKYCSRTCRNRFYYVKSKDRRAEYNRTRGNVLSRHAGIVSRCKKRGLPLDLDLQDIIEIIDNPCHYCGVVTDAIQIDRKDPVKGYVKTNVVPACRNCNTVKNNILSHAEMLLLGKITASNPIGNR